MVSKKKSFSRLKPVLKPAPFPSGPAVGVVWYSEQEWAKVKATAADAEVFENSYAEWLDMAEKAMLEVQVLGLKVEKVFVQADELRAWCLAHGKPNNGASRAEYVSQPGSSKNAN
jgi:hypothetical protein